MSFGMPYGLKERDKNGKMRSVNTINGERFVYYERLKTDAESGINTVWPNEALHLYDKAKGVLNWRITYGGNRENIGAYFAKLANAEFAKEKALLEKRFKTSYDQNSEDCGKALIEAYNTMLSTKEIFERNALLFANTNQTTLIVNFPTYLDYALEDWVNNEEKYGFGKEVLETIEKNVAEGVATGFDKGDGSEEIAEAITEVINKHSYEITDLALKKMFDAKAENGLKKKVSKEEFDQLGKAYSEVLKALQEVKRKSHTNEFIKGIVRNYDLDRLGNFIGDNLRNKKIELNKENFKNKMGSFKFNTQVKGKRGILGGGAEEILGTFLGQLKSSADFSIQGIHTGKLGKSVEQKADMTFFIGFDEGAAEAAQRKLNSFKGTGRGSNVEDIRKFTEEMFDEFGNNDGFMIYVNSKNYTPNWHFRNGYFNKKGELTGLGGYGAGTPINLDTWDDMMHKMNVRGRDFIFTILQLIPGAIGQHEDQEKVSDMFARAIGSALFDDFVPDDPYKNNHGSRVIHLLWLNNMYIPLSVFYTLLSKAFFDAEEDLQRDQLVEVQFKLPSEIKWKTQEQQNAANDPHPWTTQSREAIQATTVSYHFLKGFQTFMKRFYDLS